MGGEAVCLKEVKYVQINIFISAEVSEGTFLLHLSHFCLVGFIYQTSALLSAEEAFPAHLSSHIAYFEYCIFFVGVILFFVFLSRF